MGDEAVPSTSKSSVLSEEQEAKLKSNRPDGDEKPEDGEEKGYIYCTKCLRYILRKNMRSHNEEQNHTNYCKLCERFFDGVQWKEHKTTEYHMQKEDERQNQKIKCTICKETYILKDKGEHEKSPEHLKKVRRSNPNEEIECTSCGKEVRRKDLEDHKKHDPEHQKSKDPKYCKICKKIFTESSRKKHEETQVHLQTLEEKNNKNITCKLCGGNFIYKEKDKHMSSPRHQQAQDKKDVETTNKKSEKEGKKSQIEMTELQRYKICQGSEENQHYINMLTTLIGLRMVLNKTEAFQISRNNSAWGVFGDIVIEYIREEKDENKKKIKNKITEGIHCKKLDLRTNYTMETLMKNEGFMSLKEQCENIRETLNKNIEEQVMTCIDAYVKEIAEFLEEHYLNLEGPNVEDIKEIIDEFPSIKEKVDSNLKELQKEIENKVNDTEEEIIKCTENYQGQHPAVLSKIEEYKKLKHHCRSFMQITNQNLRQKIDTCIYDYLHQMIEQLKKYRLKMEKQWDNRKENIKKRIEGQVKEIVENFQKEIVEFMKEEPYLSLEEQCERTREIINKNVEEEIKNCVDKYETDVVGSMKSRCSSLKKKCEKLREKTNIDIKEKIRKDLNLNDPHSNVTKDTNKTIEEKIMNIICSFINDVFESIEKQNYLSLEEKNINIQQTEKFVKDYETNFDTLKNNEEFLKNLKDEIRQTTNENIKEQISKCRVNYENAYFKVFTICGLKVSENKEFLYDSSRVEDWKNKALWQNKRMTSKKCPGRDLINTTKDTDHVYRFDPSTKKEDFNEMEKDLSKFRLYVRQLRKDDLKDIITTVIEEFGFSVDISEDLVRYISRRFSDEKKAVKLGRIEFLYKMAEFCLVEFLILPGRMRNEKELNLWNRTVQGFDVTIMTPDDDHLEKIYRGINYLIRKKIPEAYGLDTFSENIDKAKISDDKIRMKMLDYDGTWQSIYFTFWKMNLTPLVLKVENEKELSRIFATARFLKKENIKPKFIVMTDLKPSRNFSRDLEVFQTFASLQEVHNKEFLTAVLKQEINVVKCQIPLSEIVLQNEDFLGKLTPDVLLNMAFDEFSFVENARIQMTREILDDTIVLDDGHIKELDDYFKEKGEDEEKSSYLSYMVSVDGRPHRFQIPPTL